MVKWLLSQAYSPCCIVDLCCFGQTFSLLLHWRRLTTWEWYLIGFYLVLPSAVIIAAESFSSICASSCLVSGTPYIMYCTAALYVLAHVLQYHRHHHYLSWKLTSQLSIYCSWIWLLFLSFCCLLFCSFSFQRNKEDPRAMHGMENIKLKVRGELRG